MGLNFMLWNKLIFLLASTTIGAWPPCMPNPAWLNLLWGCILGLTDWGTLPRDNFLLSSEAGFVFLGGGAVSSITWKNSQKLEPYLFLFSFFKGIGDLKARLCYVFISPCKKLWIRIFVFLSIEVHWEVAWFSQQKENSIFTNFLYGEMNNPDELFKSIMPFWFSSTRILKEFEKSWKFEFDNLWVFYLHALFSFMGQILDCIVGKFGLFKFD